MEIGVVAPSVGLAIWLVQPDGGRLLNAAAKNCPDLSSVMNNTGRSAVMLAQNDVVAKTNPVASANTTLVVSDGILGDEMEGVATHRCGVMGKQACLAFITGDARATSNFL